MKKDNYLESKADEIFDAAQNLQPVDPPDDLAWKIQNRLDNEGQGANVKYISYLKYAAALALLVLNVAAIYQVQSAGASVAEGEFEQLFEREYELKSQTLFR